MSIESSLRAVAAASSAATDGLGDFTQQVGRFGEDGAAAIRAINAAIAERQGLLGAGAAAGTGGAGGGGGGNAVAPALGPESRLREILDAIRRGSASTTPGELKMIRILDRIDRNLSRSGGGGNGGLDARADAPL